MVKSQVYASESTLSTEDYLVEAFDEYLPWWGMARHFDDIIPEKWLTIPVADCHFYFRRSGYEVCDNLTGEWIGEFDTLEEVAMALLEQGVPKKKFTCLDESHVSSNLFEDVLYLDRALNARERRKLELLLTIN